MWHTKSWSRYKWQHTDSWMISSYLQLFFNCKKVSQYTAEHLLISTTALFLLLTLPTLPPLQSLTTIPKALANCKLSVTCGVGCIICILIHFFLKVPYKNNEQSKLTMAFAQNPWDLFWMAATWFVLIPSWNSIICWYHIQSLWASTFLILDFRLENSAHTATQAKAHCVKAASKAFYGRKWYSATIP